VDISTTSASVSGTGIAGAATDQVGVSVLRKALDSDSGSMNGLLASLPSYANESGVGRNFDSYG
jgi:hypothetical protein